MAAPKKQSDDVRKYLESIGADAGVLDIEPPSVDELIDTDERPFDWVGPTVDKLEPHGVFARAADDKQVLRFREKGYTVVEGAEMRGVKGGTAMWCPAKLANARKSAKKRRSDMKRGKTRADSRGNLDQTVKVGEGEARVWARSAGEQVSAPR